MAACRAGRPWSRPNGGPRQAPAGPAGWPRPDDRAPGVPGSRGREPDRRGAAILLVLLALVWGLHWVVTKVGLRDMPPFTYGTLRVAGGLATLVVLLAVRGQLRLPARSDLPIVGSVCFGQVATSVALMNLALQVVPAGRSSVLVFTMPLWVAVIMAAVLRVRLARREVLALAVGIVGIALLLLSLIHISEPTRLGM